MQVPTSTLVVDAAILIAAARGRSSAAFMRAAQEAALVTTDRVVQEARRRIEVGLQGPDLLPILDELVTEMTIIPVAALMPMLTQSETVLREGVASRNGAIRDAHVLALAWSADADVWTTDRAFAGTGIASWSTPNLMRALAQATVRRA